MLFYFSKIYAVSAKEFCLACIPKVILFVMLNSEKHLRSFLNNQNMLNRRKDLN